MSQKALLSAYQQEITKLKQQLEHRYIKNLLLILNLFKIQPTSTCHFRDNILDHEEIERLEREREEAQKEKVRRATYVHLKEAIVSC